MNDLLHRLRSSLSWVAAQFWGMPLLVLAGIGCTRLPDKYAWQVFLSLLLPALLIAAFLFLQAGTMRRLSGQEREHAPLLRGALMLLAWAVVAWVAWAILDWCDDQIPAWAGYLNSRAPAHWRATRFTFAHLTHWLTLVEWVLRWIVIPGKVIPFALASAVTGWRLPVSRVLRVLWNWRWWPAVIVLALLGAALPKHIFAGLPYGTVHHQVWTVIFKLGATYLLGVISWVLLLAWSAVLFTRQMPLPEGDAITELFKRLRLSRHWVAAQFGWVLVWIWVGVATLHIPGVQRWPEWLSEGLGASYRILVTIVAFVVQAEMLRSLIRNDARRVRLVWGTLALPLWGLLYGVAFSMQDDYLPGQIFQWLLAWVLIPAILFPFAAASAVWGWRLPWRRCVRVVCKWQWWLSVLLAGTVGMLAECYFDSVRGWPKVWDVDLANGLKMGAVDMLEIGVWILLVGWLALLLDSSEASADSSGDNALHGFPAGSGPHNSDSVSLPLRESGDGGGGNA
jgi:hypothetical protein